MIIDNQTIPTTLIHCIKNVILSHVEKKFKHGKLNSSFFFTCYSP
jgi:hypothetical protein